MSSVRKVPKKNVGNRITDIRTKDGENNYDGSREPKTDLRLFAPEPGGDRAINIPSSGHASRTRATLFVTWAVAVFVIIFGVIFYQGRVRMAQSLKTDAEKVRSVLSSGEFVSNGLNSNPTTNLQTFFQGFGETANGLKDLYVSISNVLGDVSYVKSHWPGFISSNGGKELLAHLKDTREHIFRLIDLGNRISDDKSPLKSFLPFDRNDYIGALVHLNRVKGFLDNLIAWLGSAGEHRLVVFLENPSEIRPGGGFLGSYAEVTVRDGNVSAIDVHDINDADREFENKIVPPKPLQALVKSWRAADANWFFDFGLSAKKVLGFLESSKVYSNRNIVFDGAIGLSPRVVRDLLAATGPIALQNEKITIDKDNFIFEIQKQVQLGQKNGDSYPKKVLAKLAPLLLQKLESMNESQKNTIASSFNDWFFNKDIVLYFKDPAFESFFESYNVAGKVFDAPSGWNGDYLAVVNANIGGGKTDLFIKQKVMFQSQIGNDGVLQDRVIVTREHRGKDSKYPWYRMTNYDYINFFTPNSSRLLAADGGLVRNIKPQLDYASQGYVNDVDVFAVESTTKKDLHYPFLSSFMESGKNVFATWVTTALGETSKIELNYTHKLVREPDTGVIFQLMIEKQIASSGEYDIEIHAPVGFRFEENQLPVFEYHTDDLPGRLLLSLTLQKINQ